MEEASVKTVEVFCIYASEDDIWQHKLEKYLSNLQRQQLVTSWCERCISPGIDWSTTISTHVETASIILLLISSDFIASYYHTGIEMQRALERHSNGEARVIPLLLRPVDWEQLPFVHLKPLPTNERAISRWRNRDEAFLEIMRGLREIIEELQYPAITLSQISTTYWNIPYRRNPFFTGREDILTQLHDRFMAHGGTVTQPQALTGLEGMGKSQIVLEYAYRYRDDYDAILWADADSVQSLVQSYQAIAELLQLSEKNERNQSLTIEAVKRWLHAHDRWLLILNRVNDGTTVRPFLPSRPSGHIVLVFRTQTTCDVRPCILVEQLDAQEGVILLLRRLQMLMPHGVLSSISSSNRTLAALIVQELRGMPLALTLAGSYIRETNCGLSDYLERYQERRTMLLRRQSTLQLEEPDPVMIAWSLIVEKLERLNPAAIELLRLMAFLHYASIPEELISVAVGELGPKLNNLANDPLALDETLELLRVYSLVQRNGTINIVTIHPLIQHIMRRELNKNQQRHWAEQVVRVIGNLFPDPETTEAGPYCQHYLLHALMCAKLIEEWNIASTLAARLLDRVGEYLYEQEQYEAAEPLLERSLLIYQQALDTEHPIMANGFNKLATLYMMTGRYEQSEALYLRAHIILERIHGEKHPAVALCLYHLASLYHLQGRYAQAAPLYQQTIATLLYFPEAFHTTQMVQIFANAGEVFFVRGLYDQAEEYYRRALVYQERLFNPDHPNIAKCYIQLSQVYLIQEKYEEAEAILRQALSTYEELCGHQSIKLAPLLAALASLAQSQKKYEQAEEYYRRVLAIYQEEHTTHQSDIALCLQGLASLYIDLGRYDGRTEQWLQRTIDIYEHQSENGVSSDLAHSLILLARLYIHHGKYEQAEPLLTRAIEIYNQTLQPHHPDLADSLYLLAGLYVAQKKYTEAEPLFWQVAALYEQAFGHNHWRVAQIYKEIALFYEQQGEYEQAEMIYKRALERLEQILGPDHPQLAIHLDHYAELLSMMQRNVEADQLEARSRLIREQHGVNTFGNQN